MLIAISVPFTSWKREFSFCLLATNEYTTIVSVQNYCAFVPRSEPGAYPAGSGKASIRRSMLLNKRHVRWFSASNASSNGMLASLHQPLLRAGQRPCSDSLRQHQPRPQVAQIVCDHAQPQPHLVRPEPVATQPRHLHRLLPLFDPLLSCAPLVIEPYYHSAR
jgi:hypothetical protein